MPLADLPYRIGELAARGEYAYLARGKSKDDSLPGKLRVLRDVNLCDGPTLWDSITSDEPCGFYVELRLFGTRSIVEDYLASPELASYCAASGAIPHSLPPLDDSRLLVITPENYLSEDVSEITAREYREMVLARDTRLSIESLEQMVCEIRGVDSIDSICAPRRRLGKAKKPEGAGVVRTRGNKGTLRDQFVLVKRTPSRVIDVSAYGDTMQHQRGRVLDRVKHADRVAQCTALQDLFPIVSDNVAGFERAMSALGPLYAAKVSEFRVLHASSTARPVVKA